METEQIEAFQILVGHQFTDDEAKKLISVFANPDAHKIDEILKAVKELATGQTEIRLEIEKLRSETKMDMQKLQSEINVDMGNLRTEFEKGLNKQMWAIVIFFIPLVIGIIVALSRK